MSPRASSARRHLPTSPFQPAPAAPVVAYDPEDRVTHDRHGLGTVQSTDEEGWVTVRFSSGEVRRVNGTTLDKL
ncbi:hypothetical protein [Kineococcus glutinatus]|uniref:YD repeat-containing protein n=1 Tax=Kineococcus glutinatus TaxID=1070872 RepID=A0ABP9HUR0_9ACTN